MSNLRLKSTAARYLKHVPVLRNSVIFAGSRMRQPTTHNWVRFVMYHDITANERSDLARQLHYIRNIAEFVSIDEALSLSKSEQSPDGRYICITVDDGYESCYTNITPILEEFGAPGTFFVIPGFIEGQPPSMRRHPRNSKLDNMRFLSWAQCRDMVTRGMTIGSHTFSHAKLAELIDAEADDEFQRSARIISQEVGVECRHFAAPWGQPHRDFRPDRAQ